MTPTPDRHPIIRPAPLAILAMLAAGLCAAAAAAPAGAAPGNFIEPKSSPEDAGATRPTDVVSADLDGDGDLDAALTDRNGDAVKILKNDGTGNLTLAQSVPVGDFPRGIVAAKLDTGGSVDLAITNLNDSTVQVLLNSGSGSFSAQTAFAVTGLGEPIDAGLLVGTAAANDGFVDLAVTQNFDTLRVLKNDGSGGLSFGTTTYDTPGSPNLTDLVVTPLDGDLDDDIALTKGGGDDSFVTYINNGDTTFTVGQDVETGLEASSIVEAPISSFDEGASGSFGQARDLAVANGFDAGVAGEQSVTILLNNGSGTLTEPASSPEPVSGGVRGELVVGDFDGSNSTDDLAVASGSNGVSILLNGGSGNFVEPSSSPYDGTDFVTYLGLAAADVDGDGDDDIYSANDDGGANDVSVLLDDEDADGDGVADVDDACPIQPAGTANGCPPATTPPGGGTTTPPATGPDGTIQDLDTTVEKVQVQKGNSVKIKVSAGAAEAITVRASGSVKIKQGKKTKKLKLKSVTKTVEPGERVILRLKLAKKKLERKVKKAIKRYKKAKGGKQKRKLAVRSQIKVVATDADGDKLIEKRVVKLR